MGRPKAKINKKSSERLKVILEREKYKQIELAHRIFRSPQSVSRWINGTQSIPYDAANAIINVFPDSHYRLEWLMGLDDDMDIKTHNLKILGQGMTEANEMYYAVKSLVKLAGYSVSEQNINGEIDLVINQINNLYTFQKDDHVINLSLFKFSEFANEIVDYVGFRLDHITDT